MESSTAIIMLSLHCHSPNWTQGSTAICSHALLGTTSNTSCMKTADFGHLASAKARPHNIAFISTSTRCEHNSTLTMQSLYTSCVQGRIQQFNLMTSATCMNNSISVATEANTGHGLVHTCVLYLPCSVSALLRHQS